MQMFEKKLTVITFTILALIAAFSLIFVRKQHVERLYSAHIFPMLVEIPIVGAVVYYNFLPSDYYSPMAQFPLEKGERDLKFSCKYKGRHEIRVEGINSSLFWESNVGMRVIVEDEDGQVFYENDLPKTRIMGGANECYNYCYGIFNAPDEVPIGKWLTARITCYGKVDEMLDKFPEAKVVVVKVFDK